jgi:hypothetical protein
MSSDPRDAALENGRPARPAPVIRATALHGDNAPHQWSRLIPAWIISGVIHTVMLAMLLLVSFSGCDGGRYGQAAGTEQQVVDQQDEQDPRELNLTNEEIGIDPDVPTNYNVTRLEEFSVPGPVDPTQNIGIDKAPEGPPQTLPPPAGFGQGAGGGIDDPTRVGRGNIMGAAGGYMSGLKMMPGGFGGRSGATREQMLREGGGNTRSEAAVAAGLLWLSKHQAPDGHWSLDSFSTHGKCNCGDAGRQHDIAATGFGLLPFLGAGESHKPNVNGRVNKYEKVVEKGLKWLILKQSPQGDFGGGMYAHGIASIAMCEAYGVTMDPMLKVPAQRAAKFIIDSQNATGGWDYASKGPTADTSVSGWNVQALKSGQMGGLTVPKETLNQVMKYLDAYQGDAFGASYGYRSPGNRYTTNAIGLLCREYLGWGHRNPGLVKGVEGLMQRTPTENLKSMYYYYYATQVIHHVGGKDWQAWNPKMRDMLIKLQDDGNDPARRHQKGSWSCAGWDVGQYGGGRIMMTSMSLLTLEVYYRHLPLYRKELGGNKDTGVKAGDGI